MALILREMKATEPEEAQLKVTAQLVDLLNTDSAYFSVSNAPLNHLNSIEQSYKSHRLAVTSAMGGKNVDIPVIKDHMIELSGTIRFYIGTDGLVTVAVKPDKHLFA